jgi:hypothetical protein
LKNWEKEAKSGGIQERNKFDVFISYLTVCQQVIGLFSNKFRSIYQGVTKIKNHDLFLLPGWAHYSDWQEIVINPDLNLTK